mgnify:CR=1 FL=1|jgi:hypothetical protein
MSSKVATWKWGSRPNNASFVVGAIALNSQNIDAGGMTTLYISTTDNSGVSRLEDLKAIGQDSLIKLDSHPPSDDHFIDLELRVSGEPTFSQTYNGVGVIPHYVFPVTLVSAIGAGGSASWDLAHGDPVDLYGPTYGGSLSFNLDTENVTISEESTLSGVTSRSERWNTREGDIRKKMYRMTQAENSISFIYKELLRSMIASFSELGYISSEEKFIKTKCVHANAERTIAKLKQDNNIILPIVSISQTISNNNKMRRRAENVLVQEKYWDEEKNRAFRVLSFAPRAVDVMYQLNIWTKYMSDMDQILEQVRLKFNPDMEVPTKYSTLMKAYIDTEEDSGKLTAEDKEDRIIQKTINIVVEAYIPSPKFLVTSSGKIEKFLIGC